MTDHLAAAQRWLSTAQDSRSFDHLMSAMDQILDHLDAQQAAQEVTSAPQTAPQAEAGQGDGGEAVRAAEGHPAEAVRAVSAALHLDACTDDAHDGCDTGDWTSEAETALAAAEPHIRAKVAAEIEQHYLGADFGRNPVTHADSPDAHLHAAYDEALDLAARIARGEQP